MKKLLLALFVLCCGAALFAYPPPPRPPRPPVPPPPPPMAPKTGITTPHGWFDNFEAAKHESRRLNRPMLVLLTGSDWCPHCVRLKQYVLDSREFKNYARGRLVLVYLDFPRRAKLPRELRHQNQAISKRFGVGGFPTTIIISPRGHERGRVIGCPPDYLRKVMHLAR